MVYKAASFIIFIREQTREDTKIKMQRLQKQSGILCMSSNQHEKKTLSQNLVNCCYELQRVE